VSSCSLWGPGGGERVAHVALLGASGWDPTDGFDSQGAPPASMERAHERGWLTARPTPTTSDFRGPRKGKDTSCRLSSLRHMVWEIKHFVLLLQPGKNPGVLLPSDQELTTCHPSNPTDVR